MILHKFDDWSEATKLNQHVQIAILGTITHLFSDTQITQVKILRKNSERR